MVHSGRVSNPPTQTDLSTADEEACASLKIRRWVFPEPKGGLWPGAVTYPWIFAPSELPAGAESDSDPGVVDDGR